MSEDLISKLSRIIDIGALTEEENDVLREAIDFIQDNEPYDEDDDEEFLDDDDESLQEDED
jgi:hypothetical protein